MMIRATQPIGFLGQQIDQVLCVMANVTRRNGWCEWSSSRPDREVPGYWEQPGYPVGAEIS